MTRFSFSLWKVFVGLKGTGLEMDWTGLVRWIPRWGKQQDRRGYDGKQAVSSVDCLPYLPTLSEVQVVCSFVCVPL